MPCSGPSPALRRRLAESQGIAIDEQHWKRTEAARELHKRGVLPKDLSGLHRELNELRKGVFYEGDELESGDLSVEDTLTDIDTAVEIAEARS